MAAGAGAASMTEAPPTASPAGSTADPLPAGRSSFDLPVARLLVRILDLPTTWEPFVADNYGGVASSVDPARTPDLQLTCGERLLAGLPEVIPGGEPVVRARRVDGGRLTIESHWQDGWLDPDAGRGAIAFASRQPIHMRMSLENFLRVSTQLLLTRRQTFLLHSAGVIDAGRCFLFFGASGAGKSTTTTNSAPRSALSDDMVALDVSGPAAEAQAVPFMGAFPPEHRVQGHYPIAGAFRLRQSADERLERLATARAVATVSASVPFVAELGLDPAAITDLVHRLCRSIPVYDLHLTRSGRFWDLLDREFPRA